MHKIYQTLLVQMQGDNYQVFTQRYRLSKLQKITLLIKERFAKRP